MVCIRFGLRCRWTDCLAIGIAGLFGVLGCIIYLMAPESLYAQHPPLIQEVVAAWKGIEASVFDSDRVVIEYERVKSDDLRPSAAGGALLASWKIAHLKDRWLLERHFTDPIHTESVRVPALPKTMVIQPGYLIEWEQSDKVAYVDRFNFGRNIYAGLYYTQNLSLDAPKHLAKAGGAAERIDEIRRKYADYADYPFLPDFLNKNAPKYRVSARPEEVDGQMLWIVEWSGMDRLWVNPAQGFSIPRRELNWHERGPLRCTVQASDFREVQPGLWLPFKQNVERYANPQTDPAAEAGKVMSRLEYRVKAINFKEVPAEMFEVHLPPGTRVLDIVRDFQYMVTERDQDPFAASIANAKSGKEMRGSSRVLLLFNLAVLGAIAIVIGYRMWFRKRPLDHAGPEKKAQ